MLLGFAVAGVVLGGLHAGLAAAVGFIWCLVLTPITCVDAWRRGTRRSHVASPLHLEVALEAGGTYRSEPRRVLRVDGRTFDAAAIRDVYVRRFPEGMAHGRIVPADYTAVILAEDAMIDVDTSSDKKRIADLARELRTSLDLKGEATVRKIDPESQLPNILATFAIVAPIVVGQMMMVVLAVERWVLRGRPWVKSAAGVAAMIALDLVLSFGLAAALKVTARMRLAREKHLTGK
jgi:hypothetical protein